MIRPASNRKSTLQKGDGYYILVFMFFGSFILLFHGISILLKDQKIILFYQNLAFSIVLLGDAFFLKVTRRLDTSVNIGLGSLFLMFSLILFNGNNNPPALFWSLILPFLAYYSKNKKFGTVYSASFLFEAIAVALLQHFKYIITPFSTAVYQEFISVYIVIFFLSYMYKETIVKNEKQICHDIYFCGLTDLPNRKSLIQDINSNDKCTLILINVDDFKVVNNLYGVNSGDKILLEISKRLRTLYNDYIIMKIYKLHADEFALLLSPDMEKSTVIDLIKKIITRISRNYVINEMDIAITVTIGASTSIRDQLADADIALKTAKERRIPFVVYDGMLNLTQQYHQNIKKLLQLKRALMDDRIIPFFQPIIDNSDGSIHKYECLARLIDGDEILSPIHFLDISKKAKYYPAITRAMINKSFDVFGSKDIQFSINIDLDDILNKETSELIFSRLEDPQIAKNAVFELLESSRIDEYGEVAVFISKIKKLGARIAIDDFGSGYSNFEYILKLNVDFVKIDASLIRNITNDRNSRIIVENIVNFSKKLNIKTIAEFVHSEEIYNKVIELGIDFSQGYHLGKPIENI